MIRLSAIEGKVRAFWLLHEKLCSTVFSLFFLFSFYTVISTYQYIENCFFCMVCPLSKEGGSWCRRVGEGTGGEIPRPIVGTNG